MCTAQAAGRDRLVADETPRTMGPAAGNGGRGGDARRGRRRPNDLASWVLVAAMVVVAGGAAGYMYLQHRSTATSARVHAHHGRREHPRVVTRAHTATGTTSSGKAAAYYPPVGTPVRPVTGAVIEPFGWQYEKAIGLYRDVPGWALAAREGEPVRAVIGGRVVANWMDPTEGREVVVDSANGDSLIYGDLASPGPAVGTAVRAGEVFAHVGPPGKLSGVSRPHLFLELTVGGQPVSPTALLGEVPNAQTTAQATPTAPGGTRA